MSKKHQKQAKPANGDFKTLCYVRMREEDIPDNLPKVDVYDSEEYMICDGVVYGRITDDYQIDLDSIPEHVKDEFAAATLEFVRNTIRQPGGREMLDAKIEARKARKAAEAAEKAEKNVTNR